MSDIRIESMADPLLDYSSRLTESKKIGQAVRTGQVYDPFSGQTMIKTQAPPSPYHNMSREQATKIREAEAVNLQRESSLRESELKQKSDALDYKYRLNQIDQSDKFLDEMGSLDPRSPDYISQKSNLSSRYPLAAQNPMILRNIELLDKTYDGLEGNKQVLSRQQQLAEEAARERDTAQGRSIAAQRFGTEGVVMYEDLLSKDSKNPLGVAASMVSAQEKRSRISQLQELGIDPNQFYTPGVNGQAVFDTRRADAFIKTYPTASQAHQAAINKQKIRENNLGKYEEWTPDVQADYDLFDQQVQRYRSLSGQKQEKPAPAVKSVDDFF